MSFEPPDETAEQRFGAECFTDTETPERIFDRKWGLTLLERVIHRLAQEYAARGRTHLFDALQPVLLAGGSLRGGDTAQLAATLAMSEGALRVALSRLLREYRDLLEQEILQTVEARSEVDSEIAHLLDVFQAV